MATRKRTDVHRPTTLVTEDYEFFGCGYYGYSGEPGYSPMNTTMGRALLDEGWKFGGVNGGNCDHCGAHFRYYAVLKHMPTKTLIKVGETCLDNRFSRSTAEFQRMRKLAQLDREKQRIKQARESFKEEHSDVYWFLYEQVEEKNSTNDFFNSLWRALTRYGDLTERQIAAVQKTMAKFRERENAPKKPQEPTAPVVEGRITVEGRVLSHRIDDHPRYGPTHKMLVRDDRGFKVWGTVPRCIDTEVDRDVRVRFVATVKQSDRDEDFGFYSRPVDATIL